MAEAVLARARQFVQALPHSRALRMEVIAAGHGRAEMAMPWDAALVGDPRSGVIFGGAVSALMDTCGGLAVFAHPEAEAVMATLDLRIDYMRGATPGQTIRAVAECYHVTRHVAFVRITALDEDGQAPVAAASGAFSLDRSAGRPA